MREPMKPGDWVRFYREARLVIGVVQYVEPDKFSSARVWLHTDQGTTVEASVLECRAAKSEEKSQ